MARQDTELLEQDVQHVAYPLIKFQRDSAILQTMVNDWETQSELAMPGLVQQVVAHPCPQDVQLGGEKRGDCLAKLCLKPTGGNSLQRR